MDARSQRSRDALRSAVLALAAEQPIADVTASAICVAADITRDTFYRHAGNPVDLLADALGAELDELTEQLPSRARIGDAERALLEHVRSHAAVYRGTMQPLIAAAVRGRLEAVVRDGLEAWAGLHPHILPARFARDAAAMRMAVAYAAAGTVGAIEEWLRAGGDDVDEAVDVILAASPAWWLR